MRYTYVVLLGTCVALRLCCLVSKNSYYVADEYWQSLEVAHKLVFGYGYLTWEWIYGIRSYLYVSWIALLYKFLQLLQWDTVTNLTWLPCIIQGILTAISDTYYVAWAYKVSKYQQAYWSVWSYLTNVFLAYSATRTLANTIETNLTCIALYYYPWLKREIGSVKYLWFVCLASVIRPTAAIIWLPLCFYAIFEHQNYFKLLFYKYIPIGLTVLALSTLLDSYLHGKFILTWWNFLVFNVFNNISSWYSVQSVFWYFVLGLPVILGIWIVPFYMAMSLKLRSNMRPDLVFDRLTAAIIFTLVVYSMIPHKEFRFVLPLLPLMVHVSSYVTLQWTSFLSKFHSNVVALTLLATSSYVFHQLSVSYQVGTIKVMDYLRSPSNNLLFLMPCHQTPLYSHLHVNITAKFLRCDPNFTDDPSYLEESRIFYNDPKLWLEREYPPSVRLPTHVICFEKLLPAIGEFLESNGYRQLVKLYNGPIVPHRVGHYVHVYTNRKLI